MNNLKRVCLELSLKPFKSNDSDYIRSVCQKVFYQWRDLTSVAESIAIMLWTSDGSELLDYAGDMDAIFEWDRFIGGANNKMHWNTNADPKGLGLHTRCYDYIEQAPIMRYHHLKEIVATLKQVGKEMTGKPIFIGETFDPGPEFARSDFKYVRHNEICEGASMGEKSMVCCYYNLNGDDHKYAAYPNGIPDGTPFGEFIGKQAQCFLTDLGFDYIWLSNGFGFGTETWGVTGALYDGKEFFPEKRADCEEKISQFWQLFRKYCDFPIQTRGTNLTLGIDYSSDAVNHQMIYNSVDNLLPPPNSPWAALDGNFGLELAGYLSRAAELPAEDYLFRFYIHDPWWLNSPWIDRYEGQPHDIYLPMSCARIDDNGKTVVANHLNILSIDNSYGEMPDSVPSEVMPYLLSAYKNAPDAPSPVVWVYPFREYSEMTSGRLEKSFFEDWFLVAAINRSLPLSTVISTDRFLALREKNPAFLKDSVLIMPVPHADAAITKVISNFVKQGGKVLLYGATKGADPEFLQLLGLEEAQELSGVFDLRLNGSAENEAQWKDYPRKVHYRGVLTDGGLAARIAPGATGVSVLAMAEQNKESRVLAHKVSNPDWNGGAISWCRGHDCSRKATDANDAVKNDTTENVECFPLEILPRVLLSELGFTISVEKRNKTIKEPVVMMHRNKGSVWYSGYCPDTTASLSLKTPLGAPLLFANETYLNESGESVYHMPRAWRHECRVFVEKNDDCGTLHCIEAISTQMGTKRRLKIEGLKNATLYVLPVNGDVNNMHALLNSPYPHYVSEEFKQSVIDTVFGPALKIEDVSGTVLIADHTEDYEYYQTIND